MIKLIVGPALGVTLFFFLSYYQPFVETTEADSRETASLEIITPVPLTDYQLALHGE